MAFGSLKMILETAEEKRVPFWEAVLLDDMNERNVKREESLKQMERLWHAMLEAAAAYDGKLRSNSGLVGGDGQKMEEYVKRGDTLCGPFVGKVLTGAIQMGESNACMKRIVAAPTAGSCGVLPAVLVPYFQERGIQEQRILEALYTAAGIGQVIALRASISGAAGGCQAEIGSASAMAAGALVQLQGGDSEQIIHGAAIALKNLLGLVCDPVAGLVEIPCVKRNAAGAVIALSAADLALAGIRSRISPDQVIDAMKEVGDRMDESLRETGRGGLAATEDGREFAARLRQSV